MNRRDFLNTSLSGALALGASTTFTPGRALADTTPASLPRKLSIANRTIDVNGKAAKVFGLIQPDGTSGLTFDAGTTFDVALTNDLGTETLIHWHGLTPPWAQDGVPDNPAAQLKSGETRPYSFPVGEGGTHWMHAHTLQEQNLLAAPLIVRRAADLQRDEQEIVVLLHDFSFKPVEEILAKLTGSPATMGKMPMAHMNHSNMMKGVGDMQPGATQPMMPGIRMGNMKMDGTQMAGMGGMDLNDIDYDAYLANDRTLDDPQVVKIEKGGRVRLRIINGATSTAFTLSTGALIGELIAVDGQEVQPVKGSSFPISMAQRLDITLDVPKDGGAFPIMALREGALERTGIILASAGATITKLAAIGDSKALVLDLGLEQRLRAITPLAARPSDLKVALMLTGNMQGYTWAIEGGDALKVKKGQRVEVSMHNMSMMTHPMHLHGHHFQVTAINGKPANGALRDTVLIPPMAQVTIAFDANNPGRWPLHCHNLYHMATGMMSFVTYDTFG
jgi:FtsP/CotA-like multicopper oxidase with cupredoxin domain